jgi:PLP dependent protein
MIQSVLENIKAACERAGRDVSSVKLIAVTKSHTIDEIRDHVVSHGHVLLGENRVQEALPKIEAIPEAEWHLIGHLQTNKVKFCQGFKLIHSLDSEKLALEIARRAEGWGTAPEVLLEVNVGREPQKHGVLPEDTNALLKATRAAGLRVRGLMTVAPAGDLTVARQSFQDLREMRDSLGLVDLSMGMSEDYQVAILEGATMLRIGRAIFAGANT